MTPTRRIFLNVLATYGRSLYAIAIGLLCGRWTLQALGEVDYGLMGVVGGMTGFVAFFFSILSGSVSRFYALVIGECSVAADKKKGMEECRQWFSLAVSIHVVMPLLLIVIGYPIGEWAVRCFLTIPPERVFDCVLVWRFVCIGCFISMASVPFNAMYTAKQYIAELTIYSFVSTTLNALFLYWMVSHPGQWLVRFAFWQLLLGLLPQIIIAFRAICIFPECRFRIKYAWNGAKYKRMLAYTGWNTVGALGYLLHVQGIPILVNKFFGPAINASMAIANSVNGHAQTLTKSVQAALHPVITTAVGAGNMEKARVVAYRFSKLSLVLALVFCIPLSVELKYVINLWLANPPQYVVGLCWLAMAISIVNNSTLGHSIIIAANDNIRTYQISLGLFYFLTLPMAWFFCSKGFNIYFVSFCILVIDICISIGRVFFARTLAGMCVRYWVKAIILPTIFCSLASVIGGVLMRLMLVESFNRLVVCTIVCELIFIPLAWIFILTADERQFLVERFRKHALRVVK